MILTKATNKEKQKKISSANNEVIRILKPYVVEKNMINEKLMISIVDSVARKFEVLPNDRHKKGKWYMSTVRIQGYSICSRILYKPCRVCSSATTKKILKEGGINVFAILFGTIKLQRTS